MITLFGYLEDDMPRMVKTPWSTEEIPFEKAAEIGISRNELINQMIMYALLNMENGEA